MNKMSANLRVSFGEDGIAVIQMINGENRFQLSTINEWNKALDTIIADEKVRGLMITGSGKFFSNGIDLQWLSQQNGDTSRDFVIALPTFLNRLLVYPVPTVALINGHAFGAGAFLALACDFRVMRPDRGWLNWPETPLGLQFGDPLLKLARTKIPPGLVQRDALLFAKRMTGNDAKELGLVDDVTEESKMAESGKKMINYVLGKRGLGREIVNMMKKDIYGQELDLSKL